MNNIKVIDQYNSLVTEILNIEHASYRAEYQFAQKLTTCSTEIALRVMINIIVKNPPYFEETIRESIFLYVEHEGNKIIYKHLLDLTSHTGNEDVIEYLEDMSGSIRHKYEERGLII